MPVPPTSRPTQLSKSAIPKPRQQEKPRQSGKDSRFAQKKAVAQPSRSGSGYGALPPKYCTADHLPRRQRLILPRQRNHCPADEEAIDSEVACMAVPKRLPTAFQSIR